MHKSRILHIAQDEKFIYAAHYLFENEPLKQIYK